MLHRCARHPGRRLESVKWASGEILVATAARRHVVACPVDALRVEKELTLASNDADEGYVDSRGGTRTHDPGIMSAVL